MLNRFRTAVSVVSGRARSLTTGVRCRVCALKIAPEDTFARRVGDVWFRTASTSAGSADRNYFEIFGLQPAFSINAKDLTQEYRKYQKKFHPDLHGSKSQEDQQQLAENAAQVNHAYSILQNPYERAKYLLSLEGVSVNENSAFEDTEFLMEVMEIREQIESDPSPSELEQLNEQNKARMLESEQKLSAHFSNRDWDNALQETHKLRYLTTIHNTINNVVDSVSV